MAIRRCELTDEQWKLIASLMPRKKPGGRWNDHRTTLNGMMWVLKSGSPWRDMPDRYGSWKSVYHRFNRWSDDGTIDKILDRLRLRLDKDGYIDVHKRRVSSMPRGWIQRATRTAGRVRAAGGAGLG